MFAKGNADWLSELPSVIKKYNYTFHHNTKMTPIRAGKKLNENLVFDNLKDHREKNIPKFKLGQFVRTADIKRVFSEGDSTNWCYKLHTITQIIHDTISSYRIDYLTERYNENLLLQTTLSLDDTNKVMKELNLIQ